MTAETLSITCLRDPGAFRAIAEEWDRVVLETAGDVYFTADWIDVWWSHFGKGRELACLCLRRDRQLVGVLPFCIDRFGPMAVRIARLAGTDPNYAVLGLPLKEVHAVEALGAAFAHLTGELCCDAVSLSPMSELAPALAQARQAASAPGLALAVDDGSRISHTVLRLPDSFEKFLEGLSKSRRREYRRDLRKLEERFELAQAVSTPADAMERLAAFDALHTAQWRAADRQGNFDDWPGARGFYRDLIQRLAPLGRAMVVDHRGGGEALSSQFAFRLGQRAYWRLIARTLDPGLADLGIGRVGLVERVRLLIEDGVRLVEAGAGEYEYKTSYGGELVAVHRLLVVRDRSASRRRLKAVLAWADALDLLYYRGWFLKAAPRLRRYGLARGPLWDAWIRTRL